MQLLGSNIVVFKCNTRYTAYIEPRFWHGKGHALLHEPLLELLKERVKMCLWLNNPYIFCCAAPPYSHNLQRQNKRYKCQHTCPIKCVNPKMQEWLT